MTYSQWESKILGSGKLGEDFFFFTKRLMLAIYILALEYTDQVGYTKMKKGLAVFL